jgi:hypothetical protein
MNHPGQVTRRQFACAVINEARDVNVWSTRITTQIATKVAERGSRPFGTSSNRLGRDVASPDSP